MNPKKPVGGVRGKDATLPGTITRPLKPSITGIQRSWSPSSAVLLIRRKR